MCIGLDCRMPISGPSDGRAAVRAKRSLAANLRVLYDAR